MRHGTRYLGARGQLVWQLILAAGIFFLLLPDMVIAEGINGTMDLTYTRLNASATDASGTSSGQEIRAFTQLYNLRLEKNILPQLRLSAGGTFQKIDSDNIMNDLRQSSSTTLTRPYVDLVLGSPVLTLGTGFSRVATDSTTSGIRSPTMLVDTYRGYLAWKPADLPTVDVTLTRTHNYDEDRAFQDLFNDQATLFSRYAPFKTLDLNYQGTITDSRDQISNIETKNVSNGGRIMYNDRFFKDRVVFSTTYDVSYGTTEVTSGGTGTVPFRQSAFDGLFAASTSLNIGQLSSTPFLIDNDLSGTNNNLINIGSAPSAAIPPDTAPRNIGLKFGAATEMNMLLLWVNSGTNTLTSTVAGSFSWGIYTSPDGQNWSLYQTVAAAPYQPYPTLPGAGNFTITFPNVKTQYIKVVVSPIQPVGEGALFPVIAVTELQAFIQKSAAQVAGKTTNMTQQLGAYTKATLLNKPDLYYDLSYFLIDARSGGFSERRSTMTNGLTLAHRFSPVLSGSTRAERVDDTDPMVNGNIVTYTYSASLMAIPLPTLKDSLAYSYSVRETTIGRTKTNALYSNNTAELYRGVTSFLNAGWSFGTQENGQETKGSTYSYGVGLVPLKTLSITLNASDQESTATGGGLAESTTTVTRLRNAAAAYTPFSNLYLTAGISTVDQPALHDRTQSYGVNWSPFPGGALQFSFAYSESKRSADNSTSKVTQPTVRWIISRWASAAVAYFSEESSSNIGRSSTRALSFNFRAIL